MDWDKANFKRINQRKAESKRWEARGDSESKKTERKGSKHQASKKKKRKK